MGADTCICEAGTVTVELVLVPGVSVETVGAREVSKEDDSGGNSLATEGGGKVGG